MSQVAGTQPVVVPYGDCALLAEIGDPAQVAAWVDALEAARPEGVVDVVPAARTALVVLDGPGRAKRLRELLRDLPVPDGVRAADLDGPDVEIPVVYDGPDLADVAELTGMSADEVVAAHTGTVWTVAFGGFAPGFGYLVGDGGLHVPRRETARTAVPAGAVGLAGEFSGVYPRESPGGWQLIGRTDAVLWDPERDPPALLRRGVRVHFRAMGT